jgi:hypothetical protein
MADTSLRYALQAFNSGGQAVAKGEVRTSTDALVTALPSYWATIDNADADIPRGKYAWIRQRG